MELREPAKSLALLRATLDATHDAILVTDTEGNITDYNERFVTVWQLPRQLHGAKHYDVVLGHISHQFSDPEGFLAGIRHVYRTDEEVLDELQLLDGRRIERFSRVQKLDGAAVGRVWSFRDVTEARRGDESRMRLAAIVESSEDAIVSKTLEGIITTWNAGAERTFGYTADEVIGKPVTILFPPELVPEEAQILAKIRRAQPIQHYETERVRKDGKRIIISLSVSPIKDQDGNIVGASKIARDITEQREQERALAASEARLRAIIETTPDCVKVVAPDGTIELMNSAGLAMVEADSEEAVIRRSVYGLLSPEHLKEWSAHHQRVCQGERLAWEFEIIGLKGTRL